MSPGTSEIPGAPRVVLGARIELILCLVQLLARLFVAPLTRLLNPALTHQLILQKTAGGPPDC